jgi:general stress protein YciG
MSGTLRLVAVIVFAAALVVVSLVVADNASQAELNAFAEHMHGHYDQVGEIKAAVIAGDLDAVRKPAAWLAGHDEPPGLPDDWQPYIDEMRKYSGEAAGATNLVMAAAAISNIARTCGDCHRASGFEVAFGSSERPPAELDNLTTQMQRHLWAADRMWASLIGPSDGAWQQGTEMLGIVELSAGDMAGDAEQMPRVEALAERAQDIGRQGGDASTSEARAATYGEFLSLCASCHSVTGGGPGN